MPVIKKYLRLSYTYLSPRHYRVCSVQENIKYWKFIYPRTSDFTTFYLLQEFIDFRKFVVENYICSLKVVTMFVLRD